MQTFTIILSILALLLVGTGGWLDVTHRARMYISKEHFLADGIFLLIIAFFYEYLHNTGTLFLTMKNPDF